MNFRVVGLDRATHYICSDTSPEWITASFGLSARIASQKLVQFLSQIFGRFEPSTERFFEVLQSGRYRPPRSMQFDNEMNRIRLPPDFVGVYDIEVMQLFFCETLMATAGSNCESSAFRTVRKARGQVFPSA